MQKKKYNLINWILGNLICMLGIAFATKSDFGLSMIAAGPYIIHVHFHETFAWFTQGTAEYIYEAILLLALSFILRKFELKYFLTFGEAFLAGFILDGWFLVLGGNGPAETMTLRVLYLLLGLVITALGVAFFFKTSYPLQVYDFAVVKIAEKFNFKQSRTKFCYDMSMLCISLILSFSLTGKLTGMGIGTIITTLLNSTVISFWSKLIDKIEKIEKNDE